MEWCWSWNSNTLATWWEEVTHWKRPNPGKHWRQKEKGTTEDKMVGWHHRLNRHEFEQALGVDDGQGSLACCSPWSLKESDTTERRNWTELNWIFLTDETLLPWKESEAGIWTCKGLEEDERIRALPCSVPRLFFPQEEFGVGTMLLSSCSFLFEFWSHLVLWLLFPFSCILTIFLCWNLIC